MDLSLLSLAAGSSLTSGINLYATVLVLGLLNRIEIISLPEKLQILSHGAVLVTASILFLLEFIADKIPYLDNSWDAIHTFIRIPAGALLAASAFADVPAHLQAIAALIGGTVAFAAHSTKATTRIALNASPEPFSNWMVSIGEDIFTVFVLWLATHHPFVAITVVILSLVFFIWITLMLFRFLKTFLVRIAKMVTHERAS